MQLYYIVNFVNHCLFCSVFSTHHSVHPIQILSSPETSLHNIFNCLNRVFSCVSDGPLSNVLHLGPQKSHIPRTLASLRTPCQAQEQQSKAMQYFLIRRTLVLTFTLKFSPISANCSLEPIQSGAIRIVGLVLSHDSGAQHLVCPKINYHNVTKK